MTANTRSTAIYYELTFTDRNGHTDTDTIDTLEHVNDTIHERAAMQQTLTNIRLVQIKAYPFAETPVELCKSAAPMNALKPFAETWRHFQNTWEGDDFQAFLRVTDGDYRRAQYKAAFNTYTSHLGDRNEAGNG